MYLMPTSAAQCYAWNGSAWELRYDNSFTAQERDAVLAALHDALAETGFDKPPPQLWGEQTEDRGAQISWSALGQQAPYEAKKDWDPDHAKRAPLAAALIRRLPDFSVRMNAANTIDITRHGIDKAYGVRQLSAMLSIPVSDMLYVGDALFPGGNDEIVKQTDVPTRAVKDPDDTKALIEELLGAAA
jgi:hydroxymethylpyrimidine pyrophosphatase-like HAD family hydrolase